MSSKNAIQPNMLLISGDWLGLPTFKMMPVTKDCPYVECIFNPAAKVLAVIGTHVKDTFHMVPRLDDNGKEQKIKGRSDLNEQRVSLETFSEYYVKGKEEVENFLKIFAVNFDDFDYSKYLDMEMMDSPSDSPVLPGPNSKIILEP